MAKNLRKTTPSVGEDVEQLKLSYTAGGSVASESFLAALASD